MVRTRGTNGPTGKDREDIATLGPHDSDAAAAHAVAAAALAASAVGIAGRVGDEESAMGADDVGVTHNGNAVMQSGISYVTLGDATAAGTPTGTFMSRSRPSAASLMAHTMAAAAHIGSMPPRFPPFKENYNDMGELRRELKVLSVQMNLPYYMHHSSPQRLEARCPTWKNRKEVPTSCEFVVAANRHTNGRVYVTRAIVAHAPSCPAVQTSGSFVSAAALMETAKPFMMKIADTVKPRDMANIMKEKFGVSTSYMTAWRALTAFKAEKKHEETASFTKIAGYLDAFAKSNEGSVTAFEHLPGSTNIFARAFLCPKPLQPAIALCRSHLLLSVFLITSTHGGIVMTATAQDAMGDNIPIAVGIALTESEDNWRFFLEKLREAIPDLEQFISTLVFNRGPVLQVPAAAVFPKCVHSDAVDVFISPPQAFPSSVAQPLNLPGSQNSLQWLEALCSKTPLMILVGWVSKVASTLFQRFEKYGKMSSEYPEEFHVLLSQYESEADDYEVVRISEHGYEVIDQHSGRQRIVDFSKQTCTCGEYEPTRFPCLHVFLAVSFAGMMRTEVIPQIFLMKSLKALYVGRVTPIDVDTVESDNITIPNPLPKARGRPRKVQQIQQLSDIKHDKLACSICGVKGHNKRTCKRLVGGNSGALLGGIDGEEQTYLTPYGDAVFNGEMGAVASAEQVAEGDEDSPSSKRRKVAGAKVSGETGVDSTVV